MMHFPDGFLFGVATSAAQIEGGGYEDGRGASIWDAFAEKPGKISGGAKPSDTCDSYHLFDIDLKSMVDIGIDSYRMSISWGRVLPYGIGTINQKGMDYYKRCFDKLLDAGILPNVTLYHWDLPQSLEEKGGWVNRDSQYWFSEYADKMFRAFGDIIPYWNTLNEPIATYVGYGLGQFAPGHKDRAWGNQARHNVMTASGAGVEAFRASGAKGKIGVDIDIWMRYPRSNTPEDIALAKDENEENWKFYTDRLLGTGYSEYILEKFSQEGVLPIMYDDDFRLTNLPIDFYGMNYYNTLTVGVNNESVASGTNGGNVYNKKEYHPESIATVLMKIKEMYNLSIPIFVTENGYGSSIPEHSEEDGMIHDDARIDYLEKTLMSVDALLAKGIDIRGYYLWTLMDNFEWSAGYNAKYGIQYTNFDTKERVWKKSAYWYRDFIRKAKGNS